MKELIERLEKATGPDREIDALVHRRFFPDDAGAAPEYTGHIAAALLLFEDTEPRTLCIAALKTRKGTKS